MNDARRLRDFAEAAAWGALWLATYAQVNPMSFDTFATLLNKKLVKQTQNPSYIAVDRQHFALLLGPHIERIRLDPEWYLKQYPDVRDAIDRGDFASAAEHYTKVGYFEHRMPYAIEVEEAWYLEQYPDVRDAVANGVFATGQTHFARVGFREGRFPHPNFRPLSGCSDLAGGV